MTKLIEAISFLFHFISYVKSVSGIIFKAHFRSSLIEAMEAFTDVTKLVEAFDLETVL